MVTNLDYGEVWKVIWSFLANSEALVLFIQGTSSLHDLLIKEITNYVYPALYVCNRL
jgi:hypothetical protein